MTLTARDLITRALKTLQILGEDDEPTAGQGVDGLDLLNEIVDAWSADGSFLFVRQRLTFPLVSGQASRTIGPSGNFVTTHRPDSIEEAGVLVDDIEVSVDVFPRDVYAGVPDKTTTADYPLGVLYEPTETNGTLTFWPVPSSTATIVLYARRGVSAFADLSTEYALAPGFPAALRLTLVEVFGPHFNAPVPPDVRVQAIAARARVQRAADRVSRVSTQLAGMPGGPVGRGSWDYRIGRFR